MLAVKNLRVEFGPRVIFQDLTFSVREKERIAFAGHNGAGKSTLMKCIGGVLEPNGGEITKPKHCRIGYLPQEGIHIKGITLFDEAASAFAETRELQQEIARLSAELEKLDPRSAPFSDVLNQIGELELRLEGHDPARMKPKIHAVLSGLGFKPEDFDRDCGEFSGGWQMRIAMAKLFLAEPEVLLLDEPTNHLDINAQRFMEGYLRNYRGAIILISHDRSMMDGLTTRTIAFHHGRAEEFTGNYSSYETQLKERQEVLRKQKIAQDREIAKTEQFINRFRAQANKASQVQSRIKQLAKIERIEIDAEDAVMSFRFPDPPASTHLVAKLEKAAQQYGDPTGKAGGLLTVFKGLDLEVTRGEKIAIVGPNGAGKSTFCRMITGEEAPSSGHHELGPKTLPSFFNQNHADELDPTLTVLETVEKIQTRGSSMPARDVLGCFLFRGDDVFKKIGVLSGGERSRVALVRMLVRPANFLILDEPTNHLDMQSQDILQRALIDYPGTLLIVSHNRPFLDPIVQKTMEFRPGHDPRMFAGNLTYYLDKIEAEENETPPAPSKPADPKSSSSQPQLSSKERRKREAALREKRNKVLKPLQTEFESVEKSIGEFEAAQATLTAHLESPEVSADPDKLRETTQAYEAISQKLEKAYSKWEDLSTRIEQVEAELAE